MNGKQPVSPSLMITQTPDILSSKLSLLSKLLEMHIQNLLVRHFEENHPISAHQWGFTPGKSMTGALLTIGIKCWNEDTISAQSFLTTVKHLTQCHTILCCVSYSTMVSTHSY